MYRKYQNSTKSSRNERLAQLSEQESVIEKKKREILAKIEAQKKKETEEALKKFEPANAGKKDGDQPFKKQSGTREKDAEDEEPKVACPRNAFSNDGSFLDQFKKLSSGLNQKNIDLSTLTRVTKREEESDCGETSKKGDEKRIREITDDCKRRENYLEEDEKFRNTNPVQLVPHQQVPVNKSNNPVLNFTAAQSISPKHIVEPAYPGQGDVTDSPPRIPSVDSQTPTESSRQSETPDKTDVRVERHADSQFPIVNVTQNTLQSDTNPKSVEVEVTPSRQSPKGITQSDDSSRVSPALTDDEAETGDEEQSRDAGGQQGEGADSCGGNTCRKRSPVDSGGPDGLSKSSRSGYDTDEEKASEGKRKRCLDYDSTDSDSNSKDSYHSNAKASQMGKDKTMGSRDGYQADCDDESSCSKVSDQRQKKTLFRKSSANDFSTCSENADDCEKTEEEDSSSREKRKRKKKSRWGDEVVQGNSTADASNVQLLPLSSGQAGKTPMLSKLTRSDPGLLQYARQTFGSTNLSEEDWKKAEDHYKINLLYQDMVKKRAEIDRLEKAGKFKYEYDSDEDVEGGTWEHKLRQQEMMATQLWADELTRQAAGKHHIGDFLPPEELERFMEKYNAVKQGRNPDLSDYKEFKLKEDNVGYRLLQKMGWNEGQGLGQDGTGITNPVNKASTRHENQGLGVDRPDGLQAGDDEYDAYRKRMMLAYRFRPNPLNNPRRPYY